MSVRQIADAVFVSKSNVSRIVKLHNDTGGVKTSRKGRCGAKRKTTPRDDTLIRRISIMDPKISSDIKRDVVGPTSWNWRRRFHWTPIVSLPQEWFTSFKEWPCFYMECGRRARRPIKKQLLIPPMRKKKLSWAKKYKEQWRKVTFQARPILKYKDTDQISFGAYMRNLLGPATSSRPPNTHQRSCFGAVLQILDQRPFTQFKEWWIARSK